MKKMKKKISTSYIPRKLDAFDNFLHGIYLSSAMRTQIQE